jgi:SnoaL-like domain
MSQSHLEAFLDAMHEGNADAAIQQLSDDVVLWSPIFPDPFVGKAKVGSVLGVVLGVVDSFDVVDVMHGAVHTAVAFRFTSGDQNLEGVDIITLAPDGLLASLKLMWRPLPGLVAMQNRIAPLIGAPVMTLVTAETSPA